MASGLILMLLALAGWGRVGNLVPHSIVVGFSIGIAVTSALTQAGEILGLPTAVLTHFPSCYTETRRTSHRPMDGGSLEALLEQRALGGFCDRFHRGVHQLSLDRDCVEAFPHCVEAADRLYIVLPARLLFHRRWAGEESHSGLAEHFQQRAIIEFAKQFGPDVLRVEPLIQRSPQHGLSCRQ